MTNPTSYTGEQVREVLDEMWASGPDFAIDCIRSLLADRQRLKAEVEALRADANRWRHFVGLIDPDLIGGFTLYQQVDLKTDQLIYDARDLIEKIDAARATPNETKEAKS